MNCAQIPSVKEPVRLMRQDGERPDGTTILPWSRGRRCQCQLGTFRCQIHTLTFMSSTQPEKWEQQPIMQRPTRTPSTASYSTLMCSFRWPLRQGVHGTIRRCNWYRRLEDGRPSWANITGDERETTFLFQQLSVALQRGNAVSMGAHRQGQGGSFDPPPWKTGSSPINALKLVCSNIQLLKKISPAAGCRPSNS